MNAMRKFLLSSLCLLGVAVALPSFAAVHQCRGADGKISYTDRQCPKGAETTALRLPGDTAPKGPEGPRMTRECINTAKSMWTLQAREPSGQLSEDALRVLSGARSELQACGFRLAPSQLAFNCEAKLRELSQATAAAANPAMTEGLLRVQGEYNELCSDAATEADIRAHLRPFTP